MKKHAYLIMAHNNYAFLNKLLYAIDDIRNDIYLHIDAKDTDFCEASLNKLKYSNLILIKRIKIYWGGFSQTVCELELLKHAVQKNYFYYHLLSGSDFPIKSQDFIHNFFKLKHGYEFVGFDKNWDKGKIGYRCFFTNIGKERNFLSASKKIANNMAKYFYSFMKIYPRYDIAIFKGANWFSITNSLAFFILKNRKLIQKNFSHIISSDEFFIQSLIANSHFSKRVYMGIGADEYESNMRHIDWVRGTPYTFKQNDISELLESNKIFARKLEGEDGLILAEALLKHIKEG